MERRENSLRQGQKLLPQNLGDITKLPPQVLEFEEMVLGAIMIESALDKVPFLLPQHFYLESHKEVYNAILQLKSNSEPTDFRMVVRQLMKSGKLELVGGPSFVVELTTKVTSASHLEHHARVIVEMSMRRELIRMASDIHRDAYDDSIDTLDFLDRKLDELKFLRDRETRSDGPEKIKQLWEKYGITVKPERAETLIKFGDADVCTVGNVSLLVGKKKSRKSLLTVQMLYIFLSSRANNADEVCIFDTEQEEYDVWRTRDSLYRMTNQYVSVFCLRGLNPKERRDFIEQTVTHWPCKLKIAVIDGIRDCMSNINDPDETTQVMSWLMRMNVEAKIHFINILHLNKTDGNARGHIGSELLNKAEVTIEVEYDLKSTHSIVKCESSRRKPFDNFAFTHGATGLPEVVGVPLNEAVPQDEKIKRLKAIFEDQSLGYKDLISGMKSEFAIGDNKAKQMVSTYVRDGWILKSGPQRSANTMYKLMVKDQNKYVPPAEVYDNPQISLDLPFLKSFKPLDNPPPHTADDELELEF